MCFLVSNSLKFQMSFEISINFQTGDQNTGEIIANVAAREQEAKTKRSKKMPNFKIISKFIKMYPKFMKND